MTKVFARFNTTNARKVVGADVCTGGVCSLFFIAHFFAALKRHLPLRRPPRPTFIILPRSVLLLLVIQLILHGVYLLVHNNNNNSANRTYSFLLLF